MNARVQKKRGKTAATLAEKLGVSPRTIRRYVSEPRDLYLAEAQARRQRAAQLRALGMTWAEVGKAMGVSAESARALAERAIGKKGATPPPDQRDPRVPDLFAA